MFKTYEDYPRYTLHTLFIFDKQYLVFTQIDSQDAAIEASLVLLDAVDSIVLQKELIIFHTDTQKTFCLSPKDAKVASISNLHGIVFGT